MIYMRESTKSVDECVASVEASAARHGFGVLHTYDFRQILTSKGFDLANECHVLEVCNPAQASEILNADLNVNLALPCRISVYEKDGHTQIGMIHPTALVGLVSQATEIRDAAEAVDRTMAAIIDESI